MSETGCESRGVVWRCDGSEVISLDPGAQIVAAGTNDRNTGPERVDDASTERKPRFKTIVMGRDDGIGVDEPGAPPLVRHPAVVNVHPRAADDSVVGAAHEDDVCARMRERRVDGGGGVEPRPCAPIPQHDGAVDGGESRPQRGVSGGARVGHPEGHYCDPPSERRVAVVDGRRQPTIGEQRAGPEVALALARADEQRGMAYSLVKAIQGQRVHQSP